MYTREPTHTHSLAFFRHLCTVCSPAFQNSWSRCHLLVPHRPSWTPNEPHICLACCCHVCSCLTLRYWEFDCVLKIVATLLFLLKNVFVGTVISFLIFFLPITHISHYIYAMHWRGWRDEISLAFFLITNWTSLAAMVGTPCYMAISLELCMSAQLHSHCPPLHCQYCFLLWVCSQ